MTHERCNFILLIYMSALAIFVSGCATMNKREVIASMATIAERAADAAGCPACSQMAVAIGTPLAMFANPRNAQDNSAQTQAQTNEAQIQTVPRNERGITVIHVRKDGRTHLFGNDGHTKVVIVDQDSGENAQNPTMRVAVQARSNLPQSEGGFLSKIMLPITSIFVPHSF